MLFGIFALSAVAGQEVSSYFDTFELMLYRSARFARGVGKSLGAKL